MRLLAAWLSLPGLVMAATISPVEREKARLEILRDQRAVLERQLKATETSHAEAAEQLRDTEKAISATVRKLRALSEEHALARNELAEREQELRRLERQLASRQAHLGQVLRHQFQPFDADDLTRLFSGDNPAAAARDRHFLALLAQAKAELIAGLRRDAATSRRLADDLRQRGERLAELARHEESERAVLRQRQQERQAVLSRIAGQIKAQQREIATARQNEERLGNLIASLAKRPAPAAALPKKAAPASREPQSARPASVAPVTATGYFARLRGKLALPVKGSITGRFGARREDGQSFWKGLFIRAAEGSDVRAVAPGTVVFADWLRGYGNLVILDHDDGFLSVYGNNQTLLADVGQKVGGGTPVATVGTSGGQPESGLYFELRHQGRAFDPSQWLGVR